MPTSWADASEGDEARGAGDSMPGNHADRVARYVQAAEALEVLQGRVRENTGEVGNLLFDRWTADDLHELACLARDARDAKLEGFMRGEEVQPTGRITARIAGYQHAVDWDEIDTRLEKRLSAVEKRYLAKRIGQNRVAAGKPRDSHNPGQIYCEESFGEDEATEKTPWNKAGASASKPETSASSSGDDTRY